MIFFIWALLPLTVLLLAGIYLGRKVYGAVCFFGKKLSKRKRIAVTAVVTGILILPIFHVYGLWIIIFLYTVLFLFAFDVGAFVVKKCRRHKAFPYWAKAVYRSGILAVLASLLAVGYGFYNMHHVVKTEYTVLAEKEIREDGYTIVFFSDLHYGTTLNSEQLKQTADAIESENPDMVILGGDIVDERTSLAQMEEAFAIIGNIRTQYGIYYIYGNHDKSSYSQRPNYTEKQLADAAELAGIRILEDEICDINDEILLIGRADRGHASGMRQSVSQLVEGADAEKEWILIDHQPVEYAEVRESGCGLMLSGHTHAGQVWPLGFLAEVLRTNEMTYGCRQEGNLTEVVSSGIAGWGYPVRTERHSEYVVIHLINPLLHSRSK